MKSILLFIGLLLCFENVAGQTTVAIKLTPSDEDASVDDYNPNQNNPNEIEYFSGAWTIGGTPVIWHNFFKFDFSSIPANAIIQSAHLNLYFAPANNFGAQDTSLTNSNESVIQRVTSSWSENSVTWNNQPATSNQNEVILPASTTATQDYLMTDVTGMVQDMFSSSNNGFCVKLVNEQPYARLIFASGDYPDSTLYPEIIITYTACSTFVLNDDGEDATIDTYNPANNYPNEIELTSNAWTINGTPVTWRSLLKFDLSSIPSNAVINSAHLSLFYADTNSFTNSPHMSYTSSDESVIMRVISPWTENTVTWNNQPSVTNQNQVILPQSTTGDEDYLGMDITLLMQDMWSSLTGNEGFMLRLTNEQCYARMLFASGDNPHLNKHPQLEVCYTVPTSIDETKNEIDWNLYPNPSNGVFYCVSKNIKSVEVYSVTGQMICSKQIDNETGQPIKLDLNGYSQGIYFVKVQIKGNWYAKKLIIE